MDENSETKLISAINGVMLKWQNIPVIQATQSSFPLMINRVFCTELDESPHPRSKRHSTINSEFVYCVNWHLK